MVAGQTECWAGYETKMSTYTSTASGKREYSDFCANGLGGKSSLGDKTTWANMYYVLSGDSPLSTAYCYNSTYTCPWSCRAAPECPDWAIPAAPPPPPLSPSPPPPPPSAAYCHPPNGVVQPLQQLTMPISSTCSANDTILDPSRTGWVWRTCR